MKCSMKREIVSRRRNRLLIECRHWVLLQQGKHSPAPEIGTKISNRSSVVLSGWSLSRNPCKAHRTRDSTNVASSVRFRSIVHVPWRFSSSLSNAITLRVAKLRNSKAVPKFLGFLFILILLTHSIRPLAMGKILSKRFWDRNTEYFSKSVFNNKRN